MSETERKPAEVWPLAYFLAEEMAARGWTSMDVAVHMGGTVDEMAHNALVVDVILAVQKDNCVIGEKTFEDLGRAFDVSAVLFKNLDAVWRKWPDRRVSFEPDERLFSGGSIRAGHGEGETG